MPSIIRSNPAPDRVFCLHGYTPYWAKKSGAVDELPRETYLVMDLKHQVPPAKRQAAAAHFAGELSGIITGPCVVVPIPPSDAKKLDSGVYDICKMLAGKNGVLNGSGVLVRTSSKQEAHLGGPRDGTVSRGTLRIAKPELVNGRRVLLLDDMSKTGTSLATAREMMLEAGATAVEMLAMGCTGGRTKL